MLKFDLIKPVEEKSPKSSYEIVIKTMEGDADYYHHLKLYNFKQENTRDMIWLEAILKLFKEMETDKRWRHYEQNSLILSLFFGDEMIDFDGSEENYADWHLVPQFFKDMSQEDKQSYYDDSELYKHSFYEPGGSYQTYWNYDEYGSHPDSLDSYKVYFIDEDRVRWNVKFDIVD